MTAPPLSFCPQEPDVMTIAHSANKPSEIALWVGNYLALTKPRVVSLVVFCAFIGMLLAPDDGLSLQRIVAATVGIALVAGSAAVFNCLVEQRIDRQMARTRARATARGEVSTRAALLWSLGLASIGMALLLFWVNTLTAALTFATFVGYSIVYTLIPPARLPVHRLAVRRDPVAIHHPHERLGLPRGSPAAGRDFSRLCLAGLA